MLTSINTILCAVDLNADTDLTTLSMTMSLAEKYQAQVTVLHVIEPIDASIYAWGSMEAWDEIEKNALDRALTALDEQVSQFCDKALVQGENTHLPDVKVIQGHVAKSILACADDINADVIIMGSNGHNVIGGLLLGSVADKVIRSSSRPVLLVPILAA